MKIGVSIYSYAQYLADGRLDWFSAVDKAAEMGFEAIEFTDLPDVPDRAALARQLRDKAAACGLEVAAYACGGSLYGTAEQQRAEVKRLKGELDIAAELGVKLFRHDVLYKMPQHVSFKTILKTVAAPIRELAEYGSRLGIATSIENHGYCFQDYDRVEDLHAAVDHPNFGLLLDIGNFLCADQDNVQCVSRLAHLARHVHMKDFTVYPFGHAKPDAYCFPSRAQNWLLGTAVGAGDARSAQCLAILKAAGYDGCINIEFEGPGDCIAELESGLKFCKSCLEG